MSSGMSMKYRTAFPIRAARPTVSRPDIAEFGEGENTVRYIGCGRELARRSVYLHPQRRKYGSRHRKIVILLQTFAVPHPEFRLGGAACSERGRNHIPFGVYRIPKRRDTVHRAVGHGKVHTGGALAETARSRRDKRRPFDDKKHGRHLARVRIPFSGSSGISKNVNLPLRAIVYLEQAPTVTLEPDKGRTSLLPYMGGAVRQHMEPARSLKKHIDSGGDLPRKRPYTD